MVNRFVNYFTGFFKVGSVNKKQAPIKMRPSKCLSANFT